MVILRQRYVISGFYSLHQTDLSEKQIEIQLTDEGILKSFLLRIVNWYSWKLFDIFH